MSLYTNRKNTTIGRPCLFSWRENLERGGKLIIFGYGKGQTNWTKYYRKMTKLIPSNLRVALPHHIIWPLHPWWYSYSHHITHLYGLVIRHTVTSPIFWVACRGSCRKARRRLWSCMISWWIIGELIIFLYSQFLTLFCLPISLLIPPRYLPFDLRCCLPEDESQKSFFPMGGP
jgi:hypothetical protein